MINNFYALIYTYFLGLIEEVLNYLNYCYNLNIFYFDYRFYFYKN